MSRKRIAVLMQKYEGLYNQLAFKGLRDSAAQHMLDLAVLPGKNAGKSR